MPVIPVTSIPGVTEVKVVSGTYSDDSTIARFFALLESYRPEWHRRASCRKLVRQLEDLADEVAQRIRPIYEQECRGRENSVASPDISVRRRDNSQCPPRPVISDGQYDDEDRAR
jgi:hypothetical protein